MTPSPPWKRLRKNKKRNSMKELVELKQEAQEIGKLVSQLGGSL